MIWKLNLNLYFRGENDLICVLYSIVALVPSKKKLTPPSRCPCIYGTVPHARPLPWSHLSASASSADQSETAPLQLQIDNASGSVPPPSRIVPGPPASTAWGRTLSIGTTSILRFRVRGTYSTSGLLKQFSVADFVQHPLRQRKQHRLAQLFVLEPLKV